MNETFSGIDLIRARRRREILVFVLGLCLAFCPRTLPAQSVTFAWDPSPSSNITGYVLSYGDDGINFPHLIAAANTSVTVTNLRPGFTDFFRVMAYDSFGNGSAPSQPLAYFVTNTPNNITNNIGLDATPVVTIASDNFALQVSGNGSLVPTPNSQKYQTGTKHTVTATAAKGSVFVNWVSNGVVLPATSNYTFVVASNLVLQADFIPNPFINAAATYNGLFYNVTNPAKESSGSFIAALTSSGSFTAKLNLEGVGYSYAGQASITGVAPLKSIPRAGSTPLAVQLEFGLNLTNKSPITGTISDGAWTADLLAEPAIYSTTNPAPQAGKYTLLIPGSANASDQPGGNGFGAVTVTASGAVTLNGTLGDGTAITCSSIVSSQGLWPFHVSLYGGKGLIFGWLAFANTTGSDVSGQTTWFKPAQPAAKLYPGGFTNSAGVVGSAYNYTNNLPVLGFDTGEILLTNGNLPQSVTNPVVLLPGGAAPGPGAGKMTFITASGLFSGSVTNPETHQPITAYGIALQNQNTAAGYFIGANESGSAVLLPP